MQIFEAICLTDAFDIGESWKDIQSVLDRKLLVMSQYTDFKGFIEVRKVKFRNLVANNATVIRPI